MFLNFLWGTTMDPPRPPTNYAFMNTDVHTHVCPRACTWDTGLQSRPIPSSCKPATPPAVLEDHTLRKTPCTPQALSKSCVCWMNTHGPATQFSFNSYCKWEKAHPQGKGCCWEETRKSLPSILQHQACQQGPTPLGSPALPPRQGMSGEHRPHADHSPTSRSLKSHWLGKRKPEEGTAAQEGVCFVLFF